MIGEMTNRWLNVTANLGVLVGLVLVLFEMRHNQELVRVTLTNDYYSSYIATDTVFAGENLPEVWEKSLLDPENLSIKEMRIMEAQTFSPLNRWIKLYRLSEAGIVDPNFWKTQVELDANYYFNTRYGKAYYEVSKKSWTTDFLPEELRNYIDSILHNAEPETTLDYYNRIKAAIEPRSST